MAFLSEDPGEDRLQLRFVPLGDDACREIDMHFLRIARSTRPQFPDARFAFCHKLSHGIAAKAGLTLEPVATNQRNHVRHLSFWKREGEPIDGLRESAGDRHFFLLGACAIDAPVLPSRGRGRCARRRLPPPVALRCPWLPVEKGDCPCSFPCMAAFTRSRSKRTNRQIRSTGI